MGKKPIEFSFAGDSFSLQMKKVDRSRLYGYKEVEVLDEANHVCQLATLAEDGKTIVGKGGTAMAYLDVDGEWSDRSSIQPVDLEGKPIVPVKSSFASPIELVDTVTAEQFLDHSIRLLYLLESDSLPEVFLKRVNAGEIFQFKYSFRGGLEADEGFLLTNRDGELFLAIGARTSIELIELKQFSHLQEATRAATESDDLMDFEMI